MSIELDHGTLLSATSEKDREIRLAVGVFKGNASLKMFGKTGMIKRFAMQRMGITILKKWLMHVLATKAPGTKREINVTDFDRETKKRSVIATITIGRDDTGVIYVGIHGKDLPASKFPLRPGLNFDVSSDPSMDAVALSELAATDWIEALDLDIHIARMVTMEKREFSGGGGGGGRGGYGGGNRGGGGGWGGGGQKSTNEVLQDELPF